MRPDSFPPPLRYASAALLLFWGVLIHHTCMAATAAPAPTPTARYLLVDAAAVENCKHEAAEREAAQFCRVCGSFRTYLPPAADRPERFGQWRRPQVLRPEGVIKCQ